jgi:hypothetical protein
VTWGGSGREGYNSVSGGWLGGERGVYGCYGSNGGLGCGRVDCFITRGYSGSWRVT